MAVFDSCNVDAVCLLGWAPEHKRERITYEVIFATGTLPT